MIATSYLATRILPSVGVERRGQGALTVSRSNHLEGIRPLRSGAERPCPRRRVPQRRKKAHKKPSALQRRRLRSSKHQSLTVTCHPRNQPRNSTCCLGIARNCTETRLPRGLGERPCLPNDAEETANQATPERSTATCREKQQTLERLKPLRAGNLSANLSKGFFGPANVRFHPGACVARKERKHLLRGSATRPRGSSRSIRSNPLFMRAESPESTALPKSCGGEFDVRR